MTGRLHAPHGAAVGVLLVASLFLAVGCGGGGSSGDKGDTAGRDSSTVVLGLQTPLGLQGTRGVGPEVAIIYRLRDREFDRSDVEIEYGLGAGVDLDLDGEEDIDWFPATEVPFNPTAPTPSSGTSDLPGSPGVGTIHYFTWDSITDLGTGRYVTQDYVYTDDGRVLLDDFGEPVFQDFAGVRIRIRPITRNIAGSWKETDAFDVNSNNPPSSMFGAVEIPPEGVADGTVNEDVVLTWTAKDPDSDPVTIAVDWVQVPFGFDPSIASQDALESLPWSACSTGSIGEGTKSLTSSSSGIDHVWSWDSVADAGTINGYVFFRMRPLDEKLEVGEWDYMETKFHLDNYTLFTDPDAQLPAPTALGQAVLLEDTSVLFLGGLINQTPSPRASIFYPGLSQTTKGTVAEVAPGLNTARAEFTATRLADGTVLITGGRGVGDTVLNTAEIYEPVSRTFTVLTSRMVAPRMSHTATLLRGGLVLFTGGENVDGILGSAEIYDPNTGTFADAGSLVEARSGARAVRLPAGRVLIAGGTGASGALQSVEIYDPLASTFLATDAINDMAEVRAGLSLTDTTNDPIAAVAAGGTDGTDTHDSIERFDWESDEFTASAVMMQQSRADHVGVLLGSGHILFAGGRVDATMSPTGDIYDVVNDTVDTPNGEMRLPVHSATATCLENGRPVIFGGYDAADAETAQIQVFTPDGGFNYPPIAQITTPTSVEPWAFGVRFNWRAIDQEGDAVRINAQFRIKPSATDDSDVLPTDLLDVWLPASMKDKTVLGEVSSGLTGLSSREDFVTQIENPIDAPDVDPGEHLFVWFTEQDIPKGNYDNVFFRIEIQGATQGQTATSGRFSITDNAPVISRIQSPLTDTGHMVFPFYLQDSDKGDLARIVWEYGIDLNGDGKIVEADFETWASLTRTTVPVVVGGTTYTDTGITDLVTGSQDPDANNDFTDADGIPWGKLHHMVWDSVYDLGAPASTRNDVIIRCTPYDYPPGSPEDETLGIDNQASGFDLSIDPNGLTLEMWEPTVNNGAGSTYLFEGVKIDEPIVFTFSQPVDADTVTRDSIQFTKIGGVGQRVAGYFAVDNSSGKGVVTYYPQVQEVPARNDILEESTGYQLFIPAYDPANRTRDVVEREGAAADDTNGRYILAPISDANAMGTGNGVLPDSLAPNVGPLVSPTTTTDVPTDTEIELSFDERIAASSVTAEGFLVTAELFTGVQSVVYGDLQLRNVTDESGAGGALRQYAVLVFVPDTPLPATANVTISATTSLTDLAGNNLSSTSKTVIDMAAATTTAKGSFTEDFDDDANRDGDLTSAFWGETDPDGIGAGGGLGVSGYLTGMHDLGDGTDGTLDFSTGDVTIDTDVDDTLNLTSLHIPSGRSLIIEGSKPLLLKVQGDVLIEGTFDASGQQGDVGGTYYDRFNATSGDGAQGGRGGPGGGEGGYVGTYTWKQTTKITSYAGAVGYGAGSTSNGKPGLSGAYIYGSIYDYYASSGSGAGHAQAGTAGSSGHTSYYKTPAAGGTSYGSSDLSNGLEAGSGGGAGGGVIIYYAYSYSSGSYSYAYGAYGLGSGGGGGGGGGAVKVSAGGTITVSKEGQVLANGGDGGENGPNYWYGRVYGDYVYNGYTKRPNLYGFTSYPAGGGGGSGGSIWLQAGSGYALHGKLDVSGGAPGWGYHYSSGSYGYSQVGGGGGDGRLRLDGPTQLDPDDGVNFKGVVAAGESLAISGGSNTTNWSVTGSTSIDTDTGVGRPSGVEFTGGKFYAKDFTVNSGVTLTVRGSRPLVVFASGKVKIDGTISAMGVAAPNYTSSGTVSSSSGWRMYNRVAGGKGVAGGGNGGYSAHTDYLTYKARPPSGEDGMGAGNISGGAGAGKSVGSGKTTVVRDDPWAYDYEYQSTSAYWQHYYYEEFYNGGGGGGGGSGEPGGNARGIMRSYSSTHHTDETGDGGSRVVDPAKLNTSNIHGGGGGAGGSRGGRFYAYYRYTSTTGTATYTYKYYYGYGFHTAGGGGGGGVAITSSSTIEITSKGRIDTRGGKGGDHAYSSYYSMGTGPGGGGGGGSVLLEAADGFTLGAGATIDASGGVGGLAYYTYTYYSHPVLGDEQFSYGGDGGRGSIVLRAEKMPDFMNVGQADFGSAGTYSAGDFLLTQNGVTTWQDGGFHAPAYTSLATTGDGTADLFIEGAQIDPITGKVDESTATGWIAASDLSMVNGYRWFRLKVKLTGSSVSGKVPEIDSVTLDWETKN